MYKKNNAFYYVEKVWDGKQCSQTEKTRVYNKVRYTSRSKRMDLVDLVTSLVKDEISVL